LLKTHFYLLSLFFNLSSSSSFSGRHLWIIGEKIPESKNDLWETEEKYFCQKLKYFSQLENVYPPLSEVSREVTN
jgi:hypothetical protein